MKEIANIIKYFVIFKVFQLLIVYFTPVRFDTSSQQLIELYESHKQEILSDWNFPLRIGDSLISHIVDKFITWDAVYFSDLFINEIKYEHQFVFCPLWWRFIKFIPIGSNNFYKKLVLGIACSNLCHLGSCIVLYYLTIQVFKTSKLFNKKAQRLALVTSLAYVISPAGIFMTAPYSESPCAFFSMGALYLREVSINRENFRHSNSSNSLKAHWVYKVSYLLSGLLVGLAYGIRINCILLGILFVYDLYEFGVKNQDRHDSMFALASGFQLFVSIVISSWYPYSVFCPARGEWCHYWIPSLFQYAQSHYWDNGFLKYWSLANVPNFLFAMPTIVLTAQSIQFFVVDNPTKNVLPLILINALLLVGGVFWGHVQILTRISSFLPMMYWFVASMAVSDTPVYRTYSRYCLQFFIVWSLVQTSLFAAFLPPA